MNTGSDVPPEGYKGLPGFITAGSGNANITFSNNIGATHGLNLITLDGTGTKTFNGSVTASTINFSETADDAILSLAPGITLNGNITTSDPGNGILVFKTTEVGAAATVNGNIGSLGHALAEVDVNRSLGCLIDGDVTATSFIFTENGGNVSIAAGHSITTANPIAVSANSASTINYLGTTTIGSDLGSASGNKFAYINFDGGTVTLGANLYTSAAERLYP